MKAIINGLRYDTETAEELASWESTRDYSDFRHEHFTVYRTTNGAYFSHFFGGPLSTYGRQSGSERYGDEGIQPLTEDEAREHLERCGSDGRASLEKYFPIKDA